MELQAALALIVDDEPRARAALHQAWEAAESAGTDPWPAAVGMLLAINCRFVDFRGCSLWCTRFGTGLPAAWSNGLPARAQQGEAAALRACAATLVWPMLDDTALKDGTAPVAEAARALAAGLRQPGSMPANERFLLAKCLFDFHGQQMDTLAAARLIAPQQEQLRTSPPSAGAQGEWWFMVMNHHDYYADAEAALHARTRLQAVIDAHDLPDLRYALHTADMQVALKAGQLGRAERIHHDLEALSTHIRAGFAPQGLRAQASYLALRGEHAAALARIDRLLAVCADLEVPERDQGTYRLLRANVLAALGRFDAARSELFALRAHQRGVQGEVVEAVIGFSEAAARLDSEPEAVPPWLATAMTAAARLQFNRFFFTQPALAARLCERALDAGVEPDFVRTTIRDRHLAPPDPTRADWPWRLKVQVLGELRIWRDDTPLTPGGKAQRKPLKLLVLLAAHGGGPVNSEALIDALWPSMDADAPKASLEMAVSRLRKLLELPEAVIVAEGGVALNPALVWCDAVAFEALLDRLEQRLAATSEPFAAADLAALAQRLLALYRHRLLGSENLAGTMRLARERLALAFYRAVIDWGAALEARGQWQSAITLYERALRSETLAEPIYRALMGAHLHLGERAEALRTYRRCHDLLGSVLGVQPSEATRSLYGFARGAVD
jgi:DNA-binding SARP family transcriptional activator